MTLINYPPFLQTRRYSAQQMRHLLSKQGLQEGVFASGDYKVTQRAAGANMSVDVAAGDAFVQGDDVARQGLYHLVNDGVVNVVIPPAHGTLPRLDQVVARIYDSTVIGVSDTPALEVVQGVATSGALLDNRNGAAALPNGCVRLADVLVAATDASIIDAEIRDRRPFAQGAFRRIAYTSGNMSTTSTSYVEIVSSLRARIECTGNPIELSLRASEYNSAVTFNYVRPMMDGVAAQIESGAEIAQYTGAVNSQQNPVRTFTVVPPAGSHLFSWVFSVTTGTGTWEATAVRRAEATVREILNHDRYNGSA